jgi:hypothetical protein
MHKRCSYRRMPRSHAALRLQQALGLERSLRHKWLKVLASASVSSRICSHQVKRLKASIMTNKLCETVEGSGIVDVVVWRLVMSFKMWFTTFRFTDNRAPAIRSHPIASACAPDCARVAVRHVAPFSGRRIARWFRVRVDRGQDRRA